MEFNEKIPESVSKTLLDKENMLRFYKQSLPSLLKTIFTNPIQGVYRLFSESPLISYQNTLFLIASTVILYLLAPLFIIPSEFRSLLGISIYLKTGMVALIFIGVVSGISFALKSISGKPSFKQELFTGALCGIGLVMFLMVTFIIKLIIGDLNPYDMMNPARLFNKSGGLFLFLIYIFLFMVNGIQQSLRASGTKDALSWYASPVAIMLAFYITYKIIKTILV